MKVAEVITESLSRRVFHYTRLKPAVDILESGVFKLTAAVGTRAEQELAKKQSLYFLSTTRTTMGGYHNPYSDGVMFNLNGDYYNRHYRAGPVDYWGDRGNLHKYQKRSEAEDRIFSDKNTIDTGGIEEIHVFVMEMNPEEVESNYQYYPAVLRRLFVLAKKAGIPIFLYSNRDAWFVQNRNKSIPLTSHPAVSSSAKQQGGRPPRRSYLKTVSELLNARSRSALSLRAKRLLERIVNYSYDDHLSADFHNAKKPSSTDYPTLVDIISQMQKLNIKNTVQLSDYIRERWSSIK